MLYIKAKTIAECWRQSFKKLYNEGLEYQENNFFRHSPAVIEIENISKDFYDTNFPMSKKDIEIINNYLITGEKENKVTHDWTKIYRKRLFSKENDQISGLIDYLKKEPAGKRAQACVWKQETDMYAKIGPCLQIIWAQIINNKLEMHMHMRASDCYGKLLMNLNEFAALQKYIAKKLNIETGLYIQFVDTLHFNSEDKEKIEKLIKLIK